MSHSQEAYNYAIDVVDGKTVACKWVKLACQRFIDDFKNGSLEYREREANRAVKFIESLPHTKGKWANKRELLKLQPWQKFIVCNIFGWYWKESGTRRFRTAFNLIARKNGKSALAAGIALYMFVADGEYGAEVYSGATTEKQAWEVFRPAKQIVDRTPKLKHHHDIESNAKNLHVLSNGSRFEPLVGDPGDGSSPHCAIVDEYHEHPNDNLYQTMETGMGAREQPLMLVISTAGSNLAGPCHDMQKDVQRILEGVVVDESVFGVIFTADNDDEWDSDEALEKANPNLGISVSKEFLFSQRDKARRSATKQNHFKTKHLNQWVGARTAWMNILAWQKQKKPDLFEQFKQAPCHMSVDLASSIDVAALNLLFKQGDQFYTVQRFYVPESAIENNEKYQQFEQDGEMVITPGSMVDQGFIEKDIKRLCSEFNVLSIAFDDWQANYLMARLMESGLPVVNYNQTVKNMSTPMKEVEANVLEGRLFHDGNSCMSWMMGNVAARIDAKDNIYPRKENENDRKCKIDGVVALIMSMGRWLSEADQTPVVMYL